MGRSSSSGSDYSSSKSSKRSTSSSSSTVKSETTHIKNTKRFPVKALVYFACGPRGASDIVKKTTEETRKVYHAEKGVYIPFTTISESYAFIVPGEDDEDGGGSDEESMYHDQMPPPPPSGPRSRGFSSSTDFRASMSASSTYSREAYDPGVGPRPGPPGPGPAQMRAGPGPGPGPGRGRQGPAQMRSSMPPPPRPSHSPPPPDGWGRAPYRGGGKDFFVDDF